MYLRVPFTGGLPLKLELTPVAAAELAAGGMGLGTMKAMLPAGTVFSSLCVQCFSCLLYAPLRAAFPLNLPCLQGHMCFPFV